MSMDTCSTLREAIDAYDKSRQSVALPNGTGPKNYYVRRPWQPRLFLL